ncbi:hypothetical protein EV1_019997 [Malus domestica]
MYEEIRSAEDELSFGADVRCCSLFIPSIRLHKLWGAEPAELGGAWTEVAGSICACHPHPCSCIDPTPTHEDITNLDPESDRLLAN